MAQLPHKSELYAKDLTTNETELLHYSQGDYTIVNISDICSTSKYVFWIDNKLRGDYQYILKMDLKSKEVSEIIRYEQPITSVNYIDLKISGELLTWFETEELQNGFKVKGMIYNPMTDEILELEPQDMVVTNTWVNTVDNFSTYFTKNDKDDIFINSLDLQSKEIISVLVEGTPNIPYEYSSNEKWLYWLYDGGSNGIYIYNIENNKLYYLDGDDDFTIHSTYLYNNTLYVNAKSEDISSVLYKVSLGDMEITGYTSTSIKGNFDTYKSYFKTIDEKVYLYSFGDGKIYITNLE